MDDIRPPKPRGPSRLPKVQPQRIRPAPPVQTPQPVTTAFQRSASGQPQFKKPRRNGGRWVWVVGGIFIILAILAGLSVAWYTEALQPRSTTEQPTKIAIETGATLVHVADELEQKQLIKSSVALQLYARLHQKDQLHAGSYLLSPHQRPAEMLDKMISGKSDTFNVTILPGKSLQEIKEKLEKDGFEPQVIDAAFDKTYDHPLLRSKPATVNLDGYIYPETYQVTTDTTVEQLLIKAFDQFYAQIEQKNIEALLAARGLTLHQGVTLASMVQLEVSDVNERRQVAQVFEKRLAEGMTLGSDVTFLYAAKMTGLEPSVEIDSPYNTRKYAGLPPGAIANFVFPSLEAVAEPAEGDYLYFVSGDDGKTHFSRTETEHQQNINDYCTKLCF